VIVEDLEGEELLILRQLGATYLLTRLCSRESRGLRVVRNAVEEGETIGNFRTQGPLPEPWLLV